MVKFKQINKNSNKQQGILHFTISSFGLSKWLPSKNGCSWNSTDPDTREENPLHHPLSLDDHHLPHLPLKHTYQGGYEIGTLDIDRNNRKGNNP